MAKRVVALVIAVAMIAISIAVRAAVIDDDASATSSNGPLHLTCVDELAAACGAIARASNGRVQVTVEPAGATARRLADASSPADLEIDGWLTLAPWPEIVSQRRARANGEPVLATPSGRIARSPLVMAMLNERRAVLAGACPGEIDWTCIGNRAGTSWARLGGDENWGTVKPAHAEPVDSATGLLVLGQAAGNFLATPRLPVENVSRTDWETSDTFGPWFQQLEAAIPPDALATGADPFARWLQLRGVNYAVVGGLEAQIGPGIDRARALSDKAEVIYPATVATADVVFASIEGRDDDLMAIVSDDAARAALARTGWRVDSQPAAGGTESGDLPRSNGLPAAGTLDALQSYWQQVVR
jgi:hypothetical protein